MLKIITNIPLFVWPLFALLLVGGLRARKAHHFSLNLILLIPAAFFCWSLISFFEEYATHLFAIVFWIFCLVAGSLIGFSQIQQLPLCIDKKKGIVEMPGSWIPLFLSLSIFSSKFALGMMRGMLPNLEGSLLFLMLELFSILILGIFIGRGIGIFISAKKGTLSS